MFSCFQVTEDGDCKPACKLANCDVCADDGGCQTCNEGFEVCKKISVLFEIISSIYSTDRWFHV